MAGPLARNLPKALRVVGSVRQAHTIPGATGVNYWPNLSKVEPLGTGTANTAKSIVEDAFWTAERASNGRADAQRFPKGVYVPEGGRHVSTPEMEPLRHSLVDPSYNLGHAH